MDRNSTTCGVPNEQGNHNLTHRIGSPQSDFILLVLINATDPTSLPSLISLGDQGSRFAVPGPIPRIDGFMIVAMDDVLARLCGLIPAFSEAHPDLRDNGQFAASVNALAMLHQELA